MESPVSALCSSCFNSRVLDSRPRNKAVSLNLVLKFHLFVLRSFCFATLYLGKVGKNLHSFDVIECVKHPILGSFCEQVVLSS